MTGKTMRSLLFGVLGLGVIAALATLPHWWNAASSTAAIGGPFVLVDQNGRTVTDADFRGKVMVIYFGYTFCPDLCPTTLATLTEALDRLDPGERSKVAPVFITIDPERDTPARMAAYVGAFSPALIGLTGSQDQIAKVEKAYHVYARKADLGNGEYGMDHSSVLYVMGRDGRYLDHLDPAATAESLASDIRKFLG